MNKKERKKLLIDLDLTNAEIGRRLGYSTVYIWQIMNCQRRCKKAQESIAEIVGKPVEEFFGRDDGQRTTDH